MTAVAVTAFVGWVVASPNLWTWELACLPVLVILTISCVMISHSGKLIVRVSTYLETFHEFLWQKRLFKFRSMERPASINHWLAAVHIALGVLSTTTFIRVCGADGGLWVMLVLLPFVVLFLVSVLTLAFRSALHTRYLSTWESIRTDEHRSDADAVENP